MKDTVVDCTLCETQGTMYKVLSTPVITTGTKDNNENARVGEVTEAAIEENREILDIHRAEALKELYEPS